MKKYFLSLSLLLGLSASLQAAPLSPEEALQRAQSSATNLLMSKAGSAGGHEFSTGLKNAKLKFSVLAADGLPAVYAFDKANGNGSVFLAAEENALPILGYTDSGSISSQTLPPALSYWLDEYATQIASMRGTMSGLDNSVSPYASKSAIQPQIKTQWNQDAPYNDDCYITISGKNIKCMTGCVATAMAQVMNYFQYPDVGQGQITYKPYDNSSELSLNFAAQRFDWANMLDSYSGGSTPAQNAAVAYLMKACGYSVQMEYGQVESGANSMLILNALTTYFKYSDASRFEERGVYTAAEWDDLIYNHLATGSPVIYNGQSMTGGHSFVCDGYDGNGYYHFNWGWGGLSDGYFLLEALNPSSQGIGGYSGGYNLEQQVILPVKASSTAATPQVFQFGSLNGKADGSSIEFSLTTEDTYNGSYRGWSYTGTGNNVFNFAFKVEPLAGGNPQYVETPLTEFELPLTSIRYATFWVNFGKLNLGTGEYKFTLVSDRAGDNKTEWVPVETNIGQYNYIIVRVSSSGFQVLPNDPRNLTLVSIEATSPIYYNGVVNYKATFRNDSDVELTKFVAAGYVNSKGVLQYLSDYVQISVAPDSSLSKEWISTDWYTVDGAPAPLANETYKLVAYDVTEDVVMGGSTLVTISPEVELQYNLATSFPDAEFDGFSYIMDPLNGTAVVNVNVTSGYFNSAITLLVIPPVETDQGNSYSSDNSVYTLQSDPIALAAGNSKNVEFNFYFTDYNPEYIYMIMVFVDGQRKDRMLVKFRESAIEQPEFEPYDMPLVVAPDPSEEYVYLYEVAVSWEGVETLENNEDAPGTVSLNGIPAEYFIDENVLMIKLDTEQPGYYTVNIPESLFVINSNYLNKEENVVFTIVEDAGVDSILDEGIGDGKIFTVDGRYVTTMRDKSEINKLEHGLYIINGKKVMIAK